MASHADIFDNGELFQIIANTRRIVVPASSKVIGTVGDHKSEQITFKCPKTIDGHDVVNCSSHYVRWQNANGKTGKTELTNITTDEDFMYMTWDITSDVTAAAGNVSISVYFEDMTADALAYRWGTTPCSDLQVLGAAIGTVVHRKYESDNHFTIDPESRVIESVLSTKSSITQYDHNSDRFTFEIPNDIGKYDMALCNRVEIHYINISATGNEQGVGVYVVDDFEADGKVMTFSWLIGQNATQHSGTLKFMIRFARVVNDIVTYSWNTGIYSGIAVGAGFNNSEKVVEVYEDILQQWEENVLQQMINRLSVYADVQMISKKAYEALEKTLPNVLYVFTDDDTLAEIEEVLEESNGKLSAADEKLTEVDEKLAEFEQKLQNAEKLVYRHNITVHEASNSSVSGDAHLTIISTKKEAYTIATLGAFLKDNGCGGNNPSAYNDMYPVSGCMSYNGESLHPYGIWYNTELATLLVYGSGNSKVMSFQAGQISDTVIEV